ncbi:MAG: hypothetical protein SGJ00_07515 [bacterium]|nr:hypothetical protein [bacterium]
MEDLNNDGKIDLLIFKNAGTNKNFLPSKVIANKLYRRILYTNECLFRVTSNTVIITLNPSPVANFSINNPYQCFTGNNFVFSAYSTLSKGTYTRQQIHQVIM